MLGLAVNINKTAEVNIAEIADLPQILRIKEQSQRLFAECRPDIYKESGILYTDGFLLDFFHNICKQILTAKIAGMVVGYAFIEAVWVRLPMMTDRSYVYVHDMAVSGDFRNQGVATGLLGHIEAYTRQIGADRMELAVHLFCRDALALYEKLGFEARTIRMEKLVR